MVVLICSIAVVPNFIRVRLNVQVHTSVMVSPASKLENALLNIKWKPGNVNLIYNNNLICLCADLYVGN